jgi:hypothetical protein
MEDHDHEHVEGPAEAVEPVILENIIETHEEPAHDHDGLAGLLEVMFGFEHVVAEVFWNTVWLGAAFAIGRIVAFRKVHKYIDEKHGVTHGKDGY